MALAAMAEGVDQIGAAVGDVRKSGEVRERAGSEEEPLPERDEEAPAERKMHLVLLVGPGAGRERSQVGPQVAQVGIRDFRERGIRKGGEIILAVGPIAFAHRAKEIGLGPASEPRLRVRGDVRAVERPERRLERAAAGEGNGILLLFGVAADAAAGLGEIFAPFRIALGRRAAEDGAEHKTDKQAIRALSEPDHAVKHNKRPRKRKPRRGGAFGLQRFPSSASRGNSGGSSRNLPCRPRRSPPLCWLRYRLSSRPRGRRPRSGTFPALP